MGTKIVVTIKHWYNQYPIFTGIINIRYLIEHLRLSCGVFIFFRLVGCVVGTQLQWQLAKTDKKYSL